MGRGGIDICFCAFQFIFCLNRLNDAKIGGKLFMAYTNNFTSTNVKSVFKIIPFKREKEVLVNGEEQCNIRDII